MEKIKADYLYNYLIELHKGAKCALNYTNDYELLISIILSAQTTDKSVNNVTPTLFNKYKNFKELSEADVNDVIDIIRAIGLYKNKANNIINTAKKMVELSLEKVPDDFDKLISLDGVGRKTANVFLAEFYNKNTLGVDTHILRVSKRLYLATLDDDPYKTELKLKKFFKGYNTKELHHLLIAFGRNECEAKNPKCLNCKLKEYCRFYKIR